MSSTTYFAAHAGDEERLRLAGLEALYDATTLRRLLAAGLRHGQRCLEKASAAADPAAPGAALVDRVTQRSLAATERAGVWRNALGPRLFELFVGARLREVEADGACWVVPLERPEVMALIIQSLQLIAVHGADDLRHDRSGCNVKRSRHRVAAGLALASALTCLAQLGCGAAGATTPHSAAIVKPVELPGGKPGIGFDDMQWSAALGRVIVPGGRTGSVFLIEPDSLELTALPGFSKSDSYDGGHDFGVTSAIDAEGLIYAVDRTTTQLVQVDPRDKQRKAALELRGGPDYVRFVAETRELWVTEPDAGQLELIVLSAEQPPVMKSVGVIAIKRGPESLVIDHTHARAYTNSFTGSTFSIDLRTRAILTRNDNGCLLSLGIALDPVKQRVFVGCYGGQVSAFAAGTDHLLGRQDLSRGVDILAFDPTRQRLHVATSSRSELSLLHVAADGALSQEHTIATGGSASCVVADAAGRSWVCDPAHGRVLRVSLPLR